MKKKLLVSLACIVATTLLLTGLAFAGIPSSKTSSATFNGFTASGTGSIATQAATSKTQYGASADLYSYVQVSCYDDLGIKRFSSANKSGFGTSISATATSYFLAYDCSTLHQVLVGSGWTKHIDYNAAGSGSWIVY